MIPVVLVHGFLGGSRQWKDLRQALTAPRDVIALDLPGFGANADRPAFDLIEDNAAWVVESLRLQGVDRYHLLGHSMGGMIVQEVARIDADAVDQLVLYATAAQGLLPGRFETMAESKARALKDGAKATARRIAATWLLQEQLSPAYDDVAQIAESASLEAICAGLDAMKRWTGKERLAEIRQKTLIIWGDHDRTYKWPEIEALWSGLPSARLCVLPDCAHLVHLEAPEVFQRVLTGFLAD